MVNAMTDSGGHRRFLVLLSGFINEVNLIVLLLSDV